MKPNFALKLSNDGIELLHRDPSGWLSLGSVNFENDDVQAGCARLVAEANRLEPDGIQTKLVLPESQLRYATVSAPGPTDEARRYQIEAEIEALTPYSIDELIYDWSVEDDHAMIVICARDTLAEAEGFADASGFNPVAFVAAPENGQFTGEPTFGLTSVSKAYTPSGGRVQFDVEPVRIAGNARPTPAPASVPAPKADAPAPKPAVTAPAEEPAPASKPVPTETTAALLRARVDAQPRPIPPARTATPSLEATPEKPSEPLAKVGGLVRRMGTRLRREQAQETALEIGAATPRVARPASLPPSRTAPAPAPAKADAKPAVVSPPAPRPAAAGSAPKPVSAPKPESAPSEEAPISFASRRRPAPAVAASNEAPKAPDANPGGRLAVMPGKAAKSGPTLVDRLMQKAQQARSKVLDAVPTRTAATPKPASPRTAAPTPPTSPRNPAPPVVATSRPPTSEREKANEAEALTIFGARGNTSVEPSLARRGLMAAGGVMLLLVAVAVWFVYFNDTTPTPQLAQTDATTSQITTPDQIDEATTQTGIQAPDSVTALPDTPDGADTPDLAADTAAQLPDDTAASQDAAATGDVAAVAPVDVTDPDRLMESLVQEALNEALPDQAVTPRPDTATPDTAALTPDTTVGQPDAQMTTGQQTSQDAPVPVLDTPQIASSAANSAQRLSLPSGFDMPDLTEVAFAAPTLPPPFGTQFVFDENGLVVATPEGALTPSGVTVYARAPDVVPAPAPRPDVAPPALVTPVEPPETVIAPDTPRADPALAGARPRPRTERARAAGAAAIPPVSDPAPDPTPQPDAGAIQQDAAVDPTETDTAALQSPPPGGVSLAGLRPQTRPTDLVPPAVVAATAVVAEGEEVAAEAVEASLRPNARPGDIAERAQAILAAAANNEAPAPQETASAEPSIPSSASVARQATETNAIDLGDVNLIGVFGTPSDRRALVRLSSGRVVRVEVGDRLDGGRVTAIGESELHYAKSGRDQVLEIGS